MILGLAGLGTVVCIRAWRAHRLAQESIAVDIRLSRVADPDENESVVARPIESALEGVPDITEVRIESAGDHVHVRCVLSAKANDDAGYGARVEIQHRLARLAPAVSGETITIAHPTETIFIRSKVPIEGDATSESTEVCGAHKDGVLVVLDSDRLVSFGVDISDVLDVLAPKRTAAELRDIPVHGPLKLTDVATVSDVQVPSRCQLVGSDGQVYLVNVRKGYAEGRERNRKLGSDSLLESDALRVTVRPSPSFALERQRAALSSLLEHTASLPGLTLYAALLYEDARAELVYSTSKSATPESLKLLRDGVKSVPSLLWGGARGALMGATRRLVVRVTEERESAADVRKRIDALPEVIAFVHPAPTERPVVHFAPDAAAPKRLTPEYTRQLFDLALWPSGIADGDFVRVVMKRPGGESLDAIRFGHAPISAYGKITTAVERTILRINGQRVVELEWEVTDAPGLLERVTNALAGSGVASLK